MAISLNGTTGITTPGITNTGAETVVDLTTTGNTILGDASGDTLTVTGGTTTFTQGTANGVAFLNGSKVLTTGSANLTFNGTTLTVNTIGAFTLGGTIAGAGNQINNVIIGTSTPLAGAFTTVTASTPIGTASGGTGLGGATPFTANGVVYASSSSALATGSALVFDGANLGLGATPSAWVDDKAIVVNYGALSSGYEYGASLVVNAYRSTSNTWKYQVAASVQASRYNQVSGQHQWFNAPAGTAGNAITFTQAMTLDASGNLGIGTSSPNSTLNVVGAQTTFDTNVFGQMLVRSTGAYNATPRAGIVFSVKYNSAGTFTAGGSSIQGYKQNATDGDFGNGLLFTTQANGSAPAERACIDSNGNLLVGATSSSTSDTVAGIYLFASGVVQGTRTSGASGDFGRLVDDGDIVVFRQAGTVEGTISVSGTTVSYNGGHLSRWAQTTAPKDDTLVKGTVLSNLDEMNVYTDVEGNSVDNEQLNKVKVSDVEGDANVAGVFVNWSHDEDHDVDEINMAMTGDMIIRIAQGTTVQRGDLLMSAGDGTAKPQGDDIVRSKTVAKVTSNHVTCTYADGSYCVPCVLMAC